MGTDRAAEGACLSEPELLAWLTLSLCIDGRPGAWLRLADAYGGAAEVVAADDEQLATSGASPAAIALLRDAASRSAKVLETCRRLAIEIAPRGSPGYPEILAGIPDPPIVLFFRGAPPSKLSDGREADPADENAALVSVAIVGARRCTAYGERTARRLGREVAEAGIVVTSGLARGIDGAAHRGALEAGRTLAVLAGGLDRVYPGEHRELADRIVDKGGSLVSEQPPGARPLAWLFPYRNRIITGVSAATVVVEASHRSGSLASVRHALEQGREVFAVPGPIDSPACEGTNQLLVDGAPPFCRLTDLRIVRGLSKRIELTTSKHLHEKKISLATMSPDEASLLTAIRAGAATPDEIMTATALDGTRVLTLLTALELDGLVRREDHGRFRATVRGV